jgi:preprotein translocase subunit SecF
MAEEENIRKDDILDEKLKEELKATEQKALDKLKELKSKVSEDEQMPVGALTLRTILGGDILSAVSVRRQVWLILLVVLFIVLYVAFRYQCQQDMIKISQLESELKDAKYRALSSSSTLTERCRESQVLEVLRQNHDSVLHVSVQPPYIINIPQQGLFSNDEE